MLISDDPNYVVILKGIAKHLKENQIETLSFGRQGVIDFWISNLLSIKRVGEKSIAILTKDIHHIIDMLYGYEFV